MGKEREEKEKEKNSRCRVRFSVAIQDAMVCSQLHE